MSPARFKNKHVFITGASSGIGDALAREFAAQGARLTVTARRGELLDELANALRSQGTEVVTAVCDVTRENDLAAAFEMTRAQLGPADVVIANAGFGVVGRMEDLALEDYRRQFETNVFGLLRTVKAGLADLKQTRGSLVLIGSVAGYISLPNASAYAMSKFAVRALADSLWGELRPYGIGVTLISPGFVESSIRKVDNQGVFHIQTKEPIPAWLLMPAAKAARVITKAVARRKPERIVTVHGKVFVWLWRYYPWIFRFLSRRGVTGRAEPLKS